MQDFFEAPPEGAIAPATAKTLRVQYKSGKTPKDFAEQAMTDASIASRVLSGALGFSYYDKENKQVVSLPSFSFVVLEVYAGVSGRNDEIKTSYWSNRAKDTRTDELVVYASNAQSPICRGLYQDIKADLPKAAKYTKFIKAYCMEIEKVIEIELTVSSERGMQKAIADTEAAAGRKSDWKKVFILGLAKNDHFWGFRLKGYSPETKQGEPYDGDGELYFAPTFSCGVLNGQKNKDLYDKVSELRAAELELHEQYVSRLRDTPKPPNEYKPEVQYTAEPVNRNVTAAAPTPFEAPVFIPGFTDAPPANIEDLPF